MKIQFPQAITHLKQFIRNPIEFTTEIQKAHGDFFPLYLGHKKFYFAYLPEHAKQILGTHANHYKKSRLIFDKITPITGMRGLVQLEGPEWLAIRKITNEITQRQAINEYLPILNQYLDKIIPTLDNHAYHKTTFDMSAIMISYTIKSMARIVFGFECDQQVDALAKKFIELNHLCGIKMRSIISLPLSIPTNVNRAINKTRRWLIRAVEALIIQMQKNPGQYQTNLLSVLLTKLPKDYKHYSEMIHDQVMTFLFAGYETTAASLAFCFYLLGENKDAQKSIRDEAHYDSASVGDIRNLTYTSAVYREALRLFPPAWILAREVASNHILSKQKLSVGDNIILCVREIHRHNHFWSNPDVFMPERFLLENHEMHKFSFIPSVWVREFAAAIHSP